MRASTLIHFAINKQPYSLRINNVLQFEISHVRKKILYMYMHNDYIMFWPSIIEKNKKI
jgi:hypothetical protein